VEHRERLFLVRVEARRLGGDDEDQLTARAWRVLSEGGRGKSRDECEYGQQSFHGRDYTGAS
jgi:hypothetical protein